MSINWNREVKWKDVQKFFNQEVHIGEIDYHKCLQVSALIVAFGVIPAFTYGFVLGTLEDQRLSLMTEVNNLKAEAVAASQSLRVIYGARSDRESYDINATTTISFDSATSTGLIRISLQDFKGKFIADLGTITPNLGKNYFSFKLATTSPAKDLISKNDLFTVEFKQLPSNKVTTTNKFGIKEEKVAWESRINPSSPVSRAIPVIYGTTTPNITLGVFDIKTNFSTGVLSQVKATLTTVQNDQLESRTYKNLRLIDDKGQVYVANYAGHQDFEFLNVKVVPNSQWNSYRLVADLNRPGTIKSDIDMNVSVTVREKEIKFSQIKLANELQVTGATSNYFLVDNGSKSPFIADVRMSFRLNNLSDRDLYVSKYVGQSLATSSTFATPASSTISLIWANPAVTAGDAQTAYVIPAGASRAFYVSGLMVNKNGIQGVREFKITKIFYSDKLEDIRKYSIDYGLDALRVTPTI